MRDDVIIKSEMFFVFYSRILIINIMKLVILKITSFIVSQKSF